MSSSSKKKLRKEQAAEGLTKKQLDAQKEAKSLKKQTLLFIVVLAIVVCTAAATLIVRGYRNSGIRERSTVAVTVLSLWISCRDFRFCADRLVRPPAGEDSDWLPAGRGQPAEGE